MKNNFLKRGLSLFLVMVMSIQLAACTAKDMSINTKPAEEISTETETNNETESQSQSDTQKPTETETETETQSQSSPDSGYTKPVFANGTKTSEEFSKYCTDSFKDAITTNLIDFHYYVENPANLEITSYDKTFGKVELDKIFDTSEIEDELAKLKEFNYDALTEKQKQTYDILYDSLTTELEYSKYAMYSFTFGESFGVQSQLPVLLAEYTIRNENDVIEYIALLEDLPRYYKDLMAYENLRVENNLAMSDQLINGIISQCKTFIEKPEENYLIVTFDDRIAALTDMDDATKQTYMTKNKDAVLNKVIPAYQYLIDEFTKLLGKGKATGGITNYENSSEYFQYFLRSTVGTDKTPDEINTLLQKYSFASALAVSSAMSKDETLIDKLDYPTYPITEPVAIIEDLKTKIVNDFPSVPEVTCNIHTVHPSLSEFLSPAFYISAPVDNSSIQNIYINNGADGSFSGLYPTIAHEGYPGHLYQHLYYANTEHELIRDVVSFSGYAEGWATYVEMISYQYAGVEQNLADALAAYNIFMLCKYGEMDLGINYYGWSVEKFSEYAETNFGVTDAETVDSIYSAFLESPGNYLNYIFGYIEFMELKSAAETELGDKFNLKEFHKFLLDFGNAPFYIINDYMDEWIATQK